LIEVTGGIEYGGVKGRFHCALMAGLKEGAGDAGQRSTTLSGTALGVPFNNRGIPT
jgi:hypothetical protein